jgi:hypothetical protein
VRDLRAAGAGRVAEGVVVDGHRAPSGDGQPVRGQPLGYDQPGPRRRRLVRGQEHEAHREPVRPESGQPQRLELRAQHVEGDLSGDSGAIAGASVRPHRAAVGQARESAEAEGQEVPAGAALQVGQEADPARVAHRLRKGACRRLAGASVVCHP